MQNFTTDHEMVSFCNNTRIGLRAIIAIHSTRFGPALGGTRIFPYQNESDALKDVLELSQAMTYKAAAADLPFGGGKAVIVADPDSCNKRELLKGYSYFVNLLGGNFQTGEDVGTTQEDILYMREFTSLAHVTRPDLPDWLETSALTARGVLRGIEACLKHQFGSAEISGRTIAIQGLGKVGWNLARFLAEKGARLVVADVRGSLAQHAAKDFGCKVSSPESILGVEADVFSPCAMGHVLTPESVPSLNARIVAGCANNQLLNDTVADDLKARGILYAPDYVINSGGLISAMFEMNIESQEAMVARIDAIGERLLRIFAEAEEKNISTAEVVRRYVEAKLKS